MSSRILNDELKSRIMSAQEACKLINSNNVIGTNGFTGAGYPKDVPLALAESGHANSLTLICGASTGDELDGALSRANLLKKRFSFQTNKSMNANINSGKMNYQDIHLGHVHDVIKSAAIGKLDVAIIECCFIDEKGNFVPTLTADISQVLVDCADIVILELNTKYPIGLCGFHDITKEAHAVVSAPNERVGNTFVTCDKNKIKAVVLSERSGTGIKFTPIDDKTKAIANNIVEFLKHEVEQGQVAPNFTMQSGVGSVANAVMYSLKSSGFNKLKMYTEVIQDAALELIHEGVIECASATSLSMSQDKYDFFMENIDKFKDKIILRPQHISNSCISIRKNNVVAMNTAVEIDIYGNVNSTHVLGSKMINGIGGSGDFARNSALTIFMTPSTAKGGNISCIVPMVTHVDNSEHDVDIIVTECGLADLRGKTPKEKALAIIDNCAHPDYKELLSDYFNKAVIKTQNAHTPHDLQNAFSFHRRFECTNSMKIEQKLDSAGTS